MLHAIRSAVAAAVESTAANRNVSVDLSSPLPVVPSLGLPIIAHANSRTHRGMTSIVASVDTNIK